VPSGSPEAGALPGPSPAREVFLLLPGLNLEPARLLPWHSFLRDQGAAVVTPTLTGNLDAGDPAWRDVTARRWLADLSAAVHDARARYPRADLSLLGYSLGGLLGLTWSLLEGQPWRRAILLSPALGLRPLARAALEAARVLPARLLLPSLSPPDARLHPGTSVNAYRALRELGRAFRRQAWPAALPPAQARARHPGAVFLACSPRDELVRPQAVEAYGRRLARDGEPGRSVYHRLEHTPRPGSPFHLGIDPASLGADAWRRLLDALRVWLGPSGPGPR
jgi:alpha-beta hydrolase superfamily lysophospholipase